MSESQQADKLLVEGIIKGDRRTLDKIYTDYFPRIAVYITKNSGSKDDARDVFQEALIVLYRNVVKPNFHLSASLYTYLFAICRNTWLKKLRKPSFQEVTINEEMVFEDESKIEEAVKEHSQYKLYQRKFSELSAGCQEVMKMALSGKSIPEITAKMGYGSDQYTRKRKFKCKEKLIQLVKADGEFELLK